MHDDSRKGASEIEGKNEKGALYSEVNEIPMPRLSPRKVKRGTGILEAIFEILLEQRQFVVVYDYGVSVGI